MPTKESDINSDKAVKRIANGSKVWIGESRGEVLAFVPADTDIRNDEALYRRICAGRKVFDCYDSKVDRYLVEIAAVGKGKPSYRAPLAGVLERANPRAKRS